MFTEMAVRSFITNSGFAICTLLLSTYAVARGDAHPVSKSIEITSPSSFASTEPPRRQKFDCLPKDIRLDEVVWYRKNTRLNVTVEKRLIEMRARCRRGKLLDAKGREVRFFRVSCWGNPPPDYLEIRQRETAEIGELKRRYTVIVFGCNPMIQ